MFIFLELKYHDDCLVLFSDGGFNSFHPSGRDIEVFDVRLLISTYMHWASVLCHDLLMKLTKMNA